MEITIKKTVEEKHKIKLPAFYKTIAHHYKIYSETNAICVTKMTVWGGIGIVQSQLPFETGAVECSENEFLNAYNSTINELDLINNI